MTIFSILLLVKKPNDSSNFCLNATGIQKYSSIFIVQSDKLVLMLLSQIYKKLYNLTNRYMRKQTGKDQETNRGIDMSMDLKVLTDHYQGNELKLVAGSGGMHRRVTWVTMMETPDMADHLSGEELILTTGIGLEKENICQSFFQLVRGLSEHGASGVVVNTGRYISDIPEAVAEYCDRADFPLFTLPWEIRLSTSVIQPLCECIVQDNTLEEEVSTGFKNAIFFPDQEDRYIVPLSRHHFNRDDRYAICMFRIDNVSSDPYALAESIRIRLWNHLREIYPKCAVFTNDRDIIAVISTEHTAQVRILAEDLLDHVCFFLPMNKEKIYIGIGKLTKSIKCISKSYRQARAIVGLQMKGSVPQDKIFFTDMGPYRLLLGIDDDEIKEDYWNEILGPLARHDKEKGSDLVEVLRLYLENDGSISRTAEKLYVHRNTVNYKINQASKILKMDLGSLENRMELLLAYLVRDMM